MTPERLAEIRNEFEHLESWQVDPMLRRANRANHATVNELLAHIDEQAYLLANHNQDTQHWKERAEDAEAELARLREQLEDCEKYGHMGEDL